MLPATRRRLSFLGWDTVQFCRDIGTFWRNVHVFSPCSRAPKSEINIVTTVETSNFRAVFHYCNAFALLWNAAAYSAMNKYSLFGRMYFVHHQVVRVSPFGFRARYMLHYSEKLFVFVCLLIFAKPRRTWKKALVINEFPVLYFVLFKRNFFTTLRVDLKIKISTDLFINVWNWVGWQRGLEISLLLVLLYEFCTRIVYKILKTQSRRKKV
jgi:hypothetical protein